MRSLWIAVLLAGCAGTLMQPVRVEQPTFVLEATAPKSVSQGDEAPIAITIEGRGGHHVNLEYPLRIELSGSEGAQLSKSSLAAADALELNEQRARFELSARFSSAGRQQLTANLEFAVCTPDTCIPKKETIELSIVVR